ncbi:acyl-CoA reductase-like NAD-dependent aldehyde dehydrogenase [Kribbella sp. VKM Ac-2527]|uniref:Acyl-CoA reductase-like NAD-dependent aldehyde dehydrogenase n=1 Tax=Kribbella caucasensis TaxID=2512215 RepID=A0A4V3C5K9_9ACTN|nr:aldehyde dehydrogenase family protein [Kribbella sp. VKM Ac-2527]TDO30018.1 acyl-CoA reductase-like NAD-dependent aldehyde dehydrogenase [Kribbella sp. VKM Ac-2527]
MKFPSGLPIGGSWVDAPSTAPVHFPYDGSVVADAPVGNVELAQQALEFALSVRTKLAGLPSRIRRSALQATHSAISEQRDAFVDLLVLETGKPLVDCRVEVERTLLTLETSAEEVARLHGETVPLDLLPSGDGLIGFWVRKPIGVVVGITGFNYPLLLAAHKIAPALAAGCPVIVKPAPQTPLATLWLVHVVREALEAAGAPASAVQLITGGAEVGSTLTTDPRIGAVSFTGSAAVGHQIARAAAPTKVLLELGSNSALVVAEDADLDAAADAVIRGGYYASGQACISVQRVIVVESVRAAFLDKLNPRLASVVVGDPRDESTRISALIDPRSTARVRTWIDQALTAGATLANPAPPANPASEATPATAAPSAANAIQPTVLLDVPHGQLVWDEEIFGPVIAIRSVPDIATAFRTVNESRYGLHASVFTSSLDTAFTAIDQLDVGGVVVNEVPGFRSDVMPYGGVKDSGIGREGPRFAIEELTTTRMAIIRPRP